VNSKKTPTPQRPNAKEIPMTKLQMAEHSFIRSLEFGVSLEFATWDLGF
jgi:hypothetical protein